VIDAQGAPDKAIAAIQNLVQKKVNVIVTTVFPANSLAAGGLAAKAAGIPIASVGSGTGDGHGARAGRKPGTAPSPGRSPRRRNQR